MNPEFVLTYDGQPSFSVRIIEIRSEGRAENSTLRIRSQLSRGALNGSSGWTVAGQQRLER